MSHRVKRYNAAQPVSELVVGPFSAMAMIESYHDRRAALRFHLTKNFNPPISTEWILCCEWAVDRAMAGDCLDVLAPVPEGYRMNTARGVLKGLHLQPWIRVRGPS